MSELSVYELEAQHVELLPEREAMSIVIAPAVAVTGPTIAVFHSIAIGANTTEAGTTGAVVGSIVGSFNSHGYGL